MILLNAGKANLATLEGKLLINDTLEVSDAYGEKLMKMYPLLKRVDVPVGVAGECGGCKELKIEIENLKEQLKQAETKEVDVESLDIVKQLRAEIAELNAGNKQKLKDEIKALAAENEELRQKIAEQAELIKNPE